jgi:RNA-directed DNA polymerase
VKADGDKGGRKANRSNPQSKSKMKKYKRRKQTPNQIKEKLLPEDVFYLLDWHQPSTAEENPNQTKSQGTVPNRWEWVEPSVWNAKMLTTLERGVKGGKWFSLIDKVWKMQNLRSAFKRVKANKGAAGVDKQSIKNYESNLEANLQWLSKQLEEGTYQSKPIRRCHIEKPGRKHETRPIGIATVRDRVVQTALRNVIEPILENQFAEKSYGFRPRRSAKDALREVRNSIDQGKCQVLDADIQSFFDEMDHEILIGKISEHISDSRIIDLIKMFMEAEIDDAGTRHTPTKGTPQGAVISPMLANLYLNELDWLLASEGNEMIRYADDFVVMCDKAKQAEESRDLIEKWCEENKLKLHPEKTVLTEVTGNQGIDFLGYHLRKNGKQWISKRSAKKFRDNIRPLTRRTNGESLETTIAKLNPKLRGFYEYFKNGNRIGFRELDGWTRMRLRSIKRKRAGRKGKGHGLDHHRYPNVYFAELGLFSLEEAKSLKL